MKLRAATCLAALAGLFAMSSPASAAQNPGSTRGTLQLPNALTYLDTSLCPQFASVTSSSPTSRLSASVSGRYGPVYDSFFQRVRLSASVHGMITDARGNSYRVAGRFRDAGIYSLLVGDLRFSGTGRLVIAGPAGFIVGQGTLRVVTAPNELQLELTQVDSWDLR